MNPAPLWIGFLDENFERGFLTTLGLLLACLGGIFSAKMSAISLVKKKVIPRFVYLESQQSPDEEL